MFRCRCIKLATKAKVPLQTPTTDRSPLASTPPVVGTPPVGESSTVATDAVSREIGEIKSLIALQTKTIASQADQVQSLTNEIESLKAKLG